MDSQLGRFRSEDPLGYQTNEPQEESNLYRYVGNNPTNATDPSGNIEFKVSRRSSTTLTGGAYETVQFVEKTWISKPTIQFMLGRPLGAGGVRLEDYFGGFELTHSEVNLLVSAINRRYDDISPGSSRQIRAEVRLIANAIHDGVLKQATFLVPTTEWPSRELDAQADALHKYFFQHPELLEDVRYDLRRRFGPRETSIGRASSQEAELLKWKEYFELAEIVYRHESMTSEQMNRFKTLHMQYRLEQREKAHRNMNAVLSGIDSFINPHYEGLGNIDDWAMALAPFAGVNPISGKSEAYPKAQPVEKAWGHPVERIPYQSRKPALQQVQLEGKPVLSESAAPKPLTPEVKITGKWTDDAAQKVQIRTGLYDSETGTLYVGSGEGHRSVAKFAGIEDKPLTNISGVEIVKGEKGISFRDRSGWYDRKLTPSERDAVRQGLANRFGEPVTYDPSLGQVVRPGGAP